MDHDRTSPSASTEAGDEPPGESAPAEGASPDGAGISLMITKRQKLSLRERGFSEDAIRDMTPAEAHKHLGI